MSPRRATSIDVARRAGVSQATVSRVFSHSDLVAPETRARVLSAAQELDYKRNAIARSLSRQRTDIVGIVMADMTHPFLPLLLEKLTQRLQSTGRHVLLFNVTADREVDDALPFLLQYQVDAIIITSATISSEMATECVRRGTPVLLINRYVPGANVTAVSCDNAAGGRMVADLFLDAGHTRPAYIAGWQNTSTNMDRERGFCGRLRERGQIEWLREQGDYAYDSGYAAARRLLQRDAPPDAIFCANDSMAMGALDAARGLGIQVPEHLSIVGFDNIPEAGWPPYSLTTIQQPVEEMVEGTLGLLEARLAGTELEPAHHLIPGTLIRRQSARLAPQT